MTLYELNQAGYASLPNMTYGEITKIKELITKFLNDHKSRYYAMINNDKRYFTVFAYKKDQNSTKLASEIVDVAKTLGNIKAIEVEDDMVEFWIMPFSEKECVMFALFDYKKGVIEV